MADFILLVLWFALGFAAGTGGKVNPKDLMDAPYCEEVQLGKEKIKKCWKFVPVEEEK